MFQNIFRKNKKKSDVMEIATKGTILNVGIGLIVAGASFMSTCESVYNCQVPILMMGVGAGLVYWREIKKKQNGWK